jgi:polar amino acid transport system permease protein
MGIGGLPRPFDLLPFLLQGLGLTIRVTIFASVLGLFLAIIGGLGRLARPRIFKVLAGAYIEIFRGTSAVVQLFWFFFALPLVGITLPPIAAVVVALGLNVGAYGSEIVRGAVEAVPKEQTEAGIALNMTPLRRMRSIVFPQALPIMLPSFGNLLIELLKSTSLVSLVTLQDLTFKGQIIVNTTLRTPEVFTQILVIYFVLAFLASRAIRLLERNVSFGIRSSV